MIGVSKRKAPSGEPAAGASAEQQVAAKSAPRKRSRAAPSSKRPQQQQPDARQPAQEDPVWIFGLINNIEQLLHGAQQQQQQQQQVRSNSLPSSSSSSPAQFSMSQASSPSSSCSSSSSSSAGGAAIGPLIAQVSYSLAGPANPQAAALQHQIPRSPISRQIKFHEYKGPPSSKRPPAQAAAVPPPAPKTHTPGGARPPHQLQQQQQHADAATRRAATTLGALARRQLDGCGAAQPAVQVASPAPQHQRRPTSAIQPSAPTIDRLPPSPHGPPNAHNQSQCSAAELAPRPPPQGHCAVAPPASLGQPARDALYLGECAGCWAPAEPQPQQVGAQSSPGDADERTSLDGIEELIFSEYIDLNDVPLNVEEADWLKKFLPPCSSG